MKKNYLFGLLSLFTVLFMASCQEEDVFGGASDANTNVITYKVSTQQVATRAAVEAGQGAKANKLYYGVYELINNEWKLIETSSVLGKDQALAITAGTPCEVPIRLAKQKQYSVIFWAQSENEKPLCTVNWGARQMSINTDLLSNQESYDAFWGYDEVELNGAMSKNVDLKRPFAQLNIGTSDFADAEKASVIVESSAVTVKGLPTTLNLETGDVVEAQNTHAYGLAAIPNATEYAFPVEPAKYQYLALNYVLVGSEKSIIDVELSYKDSENQEYSSTFTAVPVQRNYRTNIYGTLLTNDANYTVDIKPVFTEPANEPDALHMAAAVGGTFTLTEDITLDAPLNVTSSLVLDLNGKTITGNGKDADGNKIHTIINNGNLTIKGGTVKSTAVNGGSAIYNYGALTLENTTIEGAPSNTDEGTAAYAVNNKGAESKLVVNNANISGRGVIGATDGAKVEINGGTYHTPAVAWGHAIYAIDEGTEVVINDGTFSEGYEMSATNWGMYQIYSGKKAKVTVNGGTFMPWDCANGYDLCTATEGVIEIYGGTFAEDPSNQGGKNYVASGYYALQYETGKYTVQSFDAANRTLTINTKEEFMKLNTLNEKWAEFFSNGQGTSYSDYATQGGGKGADFYYKWGWTIKLNVDIDFENETLNAPINLSGFGYFDGQNHTIKNVNITTANDATTAAGLFTASKHAELNNIKLDNVHVTGSFVGNSTAAILASDCNSKVNNITITNSSVIGGKYTGGLVGYGYTDVTNCTLQNCVVKGGYKCGGIIGYICASDDNGHNVIGNKLIGCEVDDADQYADGKSEYVIGKIVGNYNCNGTCANNVIDNMTTTATTNIGKIEAGKVVKQSNSAVVKVANTTELNNVIAASGAEDNTTIILPAGDFNADMYNIGNKKTLNIVGTEGTKLDFANLQVRASQFDELTIENCEIMRMPNKSWGHLVFGSSNNTNGVYTIKNCTFNGVGTQGIYINENVSGATYNILNCTFNGDFGGEGAITIQNNTGVNHTVNVKGCTFTNIPATSHEIYILYGYNGWTLIAEGVTPYWKAL